VALRLLENFSLYNRANANLARRWLTSTAAVTCATGGRNSQDMLTLGYNQTATIPVSTSGATMICGFAFNNPTTSGRYDICAFEEGATAHVGLVLNGDNTVSVRRGTTVITGPSVATLAVGTWQYIEFKAIIADGTGGSIEVRLNGVAILTVGSLDTRNGGTGVVTNLKLAGSTLAAVTHSYCDLYMLDASAGQNTTYLGDIRVDLRNPDGAGTKHELTGSDTDHVDNHLLVDDGTAPDDDTTYVESSTAGQIDLHTIADVPSGATVYGMEVLTLAKKTDAGARSIRVVTRQDATDRTGATKSLSTDYLYYSEVFDAAPDATAFTAAKFNALEIGYELVA
jgi:hypothetical protein